MVHYCAKLLYPRPLVTVAQYTIDKPHMSMIDAYMTESDNKAVSPKLGRSPNHSTDKPNCQPRRAFDNSKVVVGNANNKAYLFPSIEKSLLLRLSLKFFNQQFPQFINLGKLWQSIYFVSGLAIHRPHLDPHLPRWLLSQLYLNHSTKNIYANKNKNVETPLLWLEKVCFDWVHVRCYGGKFWKIY